MSSTKKLLQLEKTGRYVFHGSPNGNIDILEPRQSMHFPDLPKSTEGIPDGEPSVSATPYSDIATFRALINRKNIPFNHSSGFGVNDSGIKNFSISDAKILEEIKEKKGFVYVFNKNEFEPYSRNGHAEENSMEWRAYKSVKPIEIIEVSHEDLPPIDKIKITD